MFSKRELFAFLAYDDDEGGDLEDAGGLDDGVADSLDEGEADPAPQPSVGHDELLLQVDLLKPEPSEGEGGEGEGRLRE